MSTDYKYSPHCENWFITEFRESVKQYIIRFITEMEDPGLFVSRSLVTDNNNAFFV